MDAVTFPDLAEGHVLAAEAWSAAGRRDRAEAELARALALEPGNRRARAELTRLRAAEAPGP